MIENIEAELGSLAAVLTRPAEGASGTPMNENAALAHQLALDFVVQARAFLKPYLWHPSRFEAELAKLVGHHRGRQRRLSC